MRIKPMLTHIDDLLPSGTLAPLPREGLARDARCAAELRS